MAEDKAPRPDDFPPLLQEILVHYSSRVGEMVMEFFATGKMPEAWVRTFITLVLKKPGIVEPCHYRPINLCTTLYKIYAKLMMERMKPIMPRLICLK